MTSASSFVTAESFRRFVRIERAVEQRTRLGGRGDAAHGGEDVDSLLEFQHEPPDAPLRHVDRVVHVSYKNPGTE